MKVIPGQRCEIPRNPGEGPVLQDAEIDGGGERTSRREEPRKNGRQGYSYPIKCMLIGKTRQAFAHIQEFRKCFVPFLKNADILVSVKKCLTSSKSRRGCHELIQCNVLDGILE